MLRADIHNSDEIRKRSEQINNDPVYMRQQNQANRELDELKSTFEHKSEKFKCLIDQHLPSDSTEIGALTDLLDVLQFKPKNSLESNEIKRPKRKVRNTMFDLESRGIITRTPTTPPKQPKLQMETISESSSYEKTDFDDFDDILGSKLSTADLSDLELSDIE